MWSVVLQYTDANRHAHFKHLLGHPTCRTGPSTLSSPLLPPPSLSPSLPPPPSPLLSPPLHLLTVLLFLQVQIRRLPKPVIAMVAGYAVGGGHILHMICDLTVSIASVFYYSNT